MIAEWLFTNKCNALVDNNGDALEGEALAWAKQNNYSKTCGARVAIGAKFCRKCGAPAPGGWWTCPICGKKVGNDSPKCSHCGTILDKVDRHLLQGGVWSPEYGTFAQRFGLNACRSNLENGLEIQAGQIGILLNGGNICQELKPGNYPLNLLDEANSTTGQNGKKSVIILQSGEQKYSFVLDEMRTREGLDIRVTLAIFIAYAPGRYAEFVNNMMGNPALINGNLTSATLTMDAIAHHILYEQTELIVKRFCFNMNAEDLITNTDIPMQLEKHLASALQNRLEAYGFQFKGVSEVNFSGKMFEELQKQAGELEAKRHSLDYAYQADKYIKDHERRMSQQDFEQEMYLKELAHKAQVKDEELARELERLRQTQRMEKKLAELDESFSLAKKELVDSNELFRLQDQYNEERKSIQQNGELARRKAEHDELMRQEQVEFDMLLHKAKINDLIQRMVQETENTRFERELARRIRLMQAQTQQKIDLGNAKQNWSPQVILSDPDLDPAQLQILKEYFADVLAAGMTPEQILARGAAEGKVAAAEAMKARSVDPAIYNSIIAQIREDYARALERDERLFNKVADKLH